jgi:hypothetical protein
VGKIIYTFYCNHALLRCHIDVFFFIPEVEINKKTKREEKNKQQKNSRKKKQKKERKNNNKAKQTKTNTKWKRK